MEIMEFLQYSFVQKALIAGCLVSLISAVLGVFLVVGRYSLIGDGLAHTGFFAIALGMLLKTNPVYITLPVVGLGSLGIFKLSSKTRIPPDSAIGIVSALGIAFAVILMNLSGGFGADILSFLFGSILTVTNPELISTVILFFLVFGVIFIFYNDLVCIAFSKENAKLANINVGLVNGIFAVTVGVTIALALKLMGIMLVSALLIFPAVSALQFSKGFKTTLIIACTISVISVLGGIIFSFVLNLPASSVIVCLNFMFFMIAYGRKKFL
jgi:zinc transport system permease protein